MFLGLGFFAGWIKEMAFIGIVFVESMILKWSYNHIAEIWDIYFYQLNWTLPADRITYWHAFWILLTLHIAGVVIGRFTKTVIPNLVNVEQKNDNQDSKK
jgi:hypothetical protein